MLTEPAPSAAPADPRPFVDQADRLPAKLQWALVRWCLAIGAVAEAGDLLDLIERYRGRTQQLLEERARLAWMTHQRDEATALLEERASEWPTATSKVALAKLYLQSGRIDDARAISDALAASDPGLVTVAQLRAELAKTTGDFRAARAIHEELLEARPDNLSALLAIADLALTEGNSTEAATVASHALDLAGDAATANQLRIAARVLDTTGHGDRASSLRDHAVALDAARQSRLVEELRETVGELDGAALPVGAHGRAPTADQPAPAPAPEPPVILSEAKNLSRAASANQTVPPVEEDGERFFAAAQNDRGTRADHGTRADERPRDDDGAGDGIEPLPPTPEPAEIDPRVVEMLRELFGHAALRPGQAAVIANVLARRDTLATMPTGAGKSLTFQLPAMLLDGVTLVISPLIALMKDQVETLPPAVRERTVLVNSTLSPAEQRQALDDIADGRFQLVYAAPERLRHDAFVRAMRAAGTALVVIDEAHCISLWGHDFRPDYLSIPMSLPDLGDPPLLAITATATPAMADAVAAGLGREMDRVRVNLFRPNLFYEVHWLNNREQKLTKVVELCRRERGSGIVYVSSRRDADAIAGVLRDRGVGAIPYHAGLDPETRARNQERFMAGQVRVVVATVAFGMGVDKADVRFIVHLSPPRSLEAYAQESGRAGRDGRPARCALLVAPSDQATLSRLARRDELEIDTIRRVYAGLQREAIGRWALIDPADLVPATGPTGDRDDDPRIALGLLEQAGLVRRHPDAPLTHVLSSRGADTGALLDFVGRPVRTAEICDALDVTPRELDRLIASEDNLVSRDGPRGVCFELLPTGRDAAARLGQVLERARREAKRRIDQVMAYAAGATCRHAALAAHLGERIPACGTVCDVCTGQAAHAPARSAREQAADAGPRRSAITADDALAVLRAVRTLPFPMGKTGLAKLLAGSVESRIRADRSSAFGALKELTRGRIETLIDGLVDQGFLRRDLEHEFNLISLTDQGADATPGDLAAVTRPAATRTTRTATATPPETPLDAAGTALFERLVAWRRDRAADDRVPPYVVAHNSMLHALAAARPHDEDALGAVPGFGPARLEKYGAEVLAIING